MIHLKQILLESTGLTPAAKYCMDTILSMPKFARSKWSIIGTIANRNVGTTAVTSQHAYGNAIDWHGARGVGDPVMQQLSDYLVENRVEFNVQNVIYNRSIWNLPTGWHTYKIPKGGSPHTDHVHVDFIIGATNIINKNDVNKTNNSLLRTAISNMEDVTTRYPATWFKDYSSWNPFATGIGDDEEGASGKFLELYEKYVMTAAIDKMKNISDYDQYNIKQLQSACNEIYQYILNGDTGTITFEFHEWVPTTKSYISKTKSFKWWYL